MTTPLIQDLVVKRADERRLYRFTFDDQREIVGGDYILTADSLTCAPSGLTLTVQAVASQYVDFWCEHGTGDTVYAVSCRVTTAGGAVLTEVGGVRVIDP